MKISLSLYLFMVVQLMANTASSQERVSLDLKDATLAAIIKQIEDQTSYRFIYNNDEVDDGTRFDVRGQDEGLDKVLKQLFGGSTISYEIKKRHVILSKRRVVRRAPVQESYSISGTVRDGDTGETLLGATITVVGTSKGVVTNEYGFYSITLPSGTHRLSVSYIGYQPKEVSIDLNQNQKLAFELVQVSNELSEVVVFSDSKIHSQVASVLNGVTNLKSADIKKLPSLLGEPDVTRAILTQSGVTTIGEGASGFSVRGGNIDQNLILLDEAPIYNSSHVWGFFSIFNTDA
ncbi:MAG: carboxypeptidase-like regulatory domain-containing protein, partial [Flavobacteriaceae bacterium]